MSKYWLMKSEPSVYSIDDLKQDTQTQWEGVRNYQARNFMYKQMNIGDLALFYHSNAMPPGVAGTCKVCSKAYPDHFAWNPDSKYFDPKSTPETPRWHMVDVKFVNKFQTYIPLQNIREHPTLQEMMVIQKGSRLSIQPITQTEFDTIQQLGTQP